MRQLSNYIDLVTRESDHHNEKLWLNLLSSKLLAPIKEVIDIAREHSERFAKKQDEQPSEV